MDGSRPVQPSGSAGREVKRDEAANGKGAETARHLDQQMRELRDRITALEGALAQATAELNTLRNSDEHQLGHQLLVRWRLRAPYRFLARHGRRMGYLLRLWKLALERRLSYRRKRMMASICGNFPIYSQTFVYQELVQLQNHGFEIRHAYSFPLPRTDLHASFATLWPCRRLLVHDYGQHQADFAHYRRLHPARTDALIAGLAEASGMAKDAVVHHHDFLRGFTFTRMVEAWRPQWLHSYFFYERSLYSLIAAWILDIPRGISTYADHVLKDYEFKLVPLHLKLCEVVVATSARIKQELLALAPGVDPDKILVKPNAIDAEHFPVVERYQPAAEQPWRLACVARIEPKKGLLHLAEAVRILKFDRGRKVELHLIGEPDRGNKASQDYARQLSEYCSKHDLRGAIHLEGRRPQGEVRRFLEGSHVFVAPFVETETGDKDGIPTALLEAMATGIAVVTTDSGSMLEVVTAGVDAIVVPQRDAKALADAIEALLLDPQRRKQFGQAGAEKIRKAFDVRVCEARLHARIDAVLAARAPAKNG